MSEWLIVRHQVAIAGRVIDEQTGRTIAGAQITITQMPPEFKDRLEVMAKVDGARWKTLAARPDHTRTAADGCFYFLDLPDGQYTVTASVPAVGRRYGTGKAQARVSVDEEGNITMTTANIALEATK